MSDIPEAFMTDARECLNGINGDWDTLCDEDNVMRIARALMAAAREADEAATKRERERCAKCVKDCASALDFPSVYMGGPSRDAIRKSAVLAEAILKGEA